MAARSPWPGALPAPWTEARVKAGGVGGGTAHFPWDEAGGEVLERSVGSPAQVEMTGLGRMLQGGDRSDQRGPHPTWRPGVAEPARAPGSRLLQPDHSTEGKTGSDRGGDLGPRLRAGRERHP